MCALWTFVPLGFILNPQSVIVLGDGVLKSSHTTTFFKFKLASSNCLPFFVTNIIFVREYLILRPAR